MQNWFLNTNLDNSRFRAEEVPFLNKMNIVITFSEVLLNESKKSQTPIQPEI